MQGFKPKELSVSEISWQTISLLCCEEDDIRDQDLDMCPHLSSVRAHLQLHLRSKSSLKAMIGSNASIAASLFNASTDRAYLADAIAGVVER